MHIPITKQTVDLTTGETTVETVQFRLQPAPPGTCPECATKHEAEQPHNAQSMFYQYAFYGQHGRWPTWADAMQHCSAEIQQHWIKELEKYGISITAETKDGRK